MVEKLVSSREELVCEQSCVLPKRMKAWFLAKGGHFEV